MTIRLILIIFFFFILETKSQDIKSFKKPWINIGGNEKVDSNKNSIITLSEGKNENVGKKISGSKSQLSSSKNNGKKNSKDNGDSSVFEDPPTPESKIISKSDDGSIAFSLWYPMCLFMDPSISQAQGNSTVKAMVDEIAQKCGVNLIIYPITTIPLPDDYKLINNAQRASCNVAGNVGNATSAVSSTCVPFEFTADEMCGGERGKSKIAGCSEIGGPPGEAERVKRLYEQKKEQLRKEGRTINPLFDEKNPSGGSAGTRVSIEDAGNCSAPLVNHEAIGHSMMGWGHGPEGGYRIGYSGGGGSDGWTVPGCAAIKRASFPNDGQWRWNPKRTTYYVKQNELFKLGEDKLFGPPAVKKKVRDKLLSSNRRNQSFIPSLRNDPPTLRNDPPKDSSTPKKLEPILSGNEKTHQNNSNPGSNIAISNGNFTEDQDDNESNKYRQSPPPFMGNIQRPQRLELNMKAPKKLNRSGSRNGSTSVKVDTFRSNISDYKGISYENESKNNGNRSNRRTPSSIRFTPK